jgi:putrescine transport system permease protein
MSAAPPDLADRALQRLGFGSRLRRLRPRGRSLAAAVPYFWLLLFFLIPFVIVLKISFSETQIAMPPYQPLLHWASEKVLDIRLNLANYLFLVEDNLYWKAYLNSIWVAAVSTLLCLLIGYPLAYAIARSKPATRNVLLLLVILPFWTSFLLRVYAWMGILNSHGTLNNVLLWAGLIDRPLEILYSDTAVFLGMAYSYLPFMILPLYANLARLDQDLLDAAADLGGRPRQAFLDVTLPLSLPGVIAGCLLVFIPAIGEFVIPALLGGYDTLMIGRVVYDEFFLNRDWPVASAVAVLLLLLLLVPIAIFQRYESQDEPRA